MNLKKISIKNKLLGVILVVVIPVLIAQSILSISRETTALKNKLEGELFTSAKMAVEYCSESLSKKDKKGATRNLSILKHNPSIYFAELFDKTNASFSSVGLNPSFDKSIFKEFPPLGQTRTINDYLVRTEPVYKNGDLIGYIIIYMSTEILDSSINIAKITGLIVLFSFLFFAIFISMVMQRIISQPVLELTDFLTNVTTTLDYSQRANANSKDELAILAVKLNSLLQTIDETTVSKNLMDKIITSMGDGLLIVDSNGFILRSNNAAQNLLEYTERGFKGKNIRNFCEQHFKLDTAEKFAELQFKTAFDKLIDVEYYGSQLEENTIVCILHDITQRKINEHQIKGSLKEKESLIKEIHHRVKNNLQVVSSLLNLQSGTIDDEAAKEAFAKSKDRIRSMALIHAKLYQTNDLVNIDVHDYVESLAREILLTYNYGSPVELDIVPPSSKFNIDILVPVGLMLNELITNSVKYAFKDTEKGKIGIHFSENMGSIKLIYTDNGKGLPDDFDLESSDTLGSQLILTFVEQLDGTIKFIKQPTGVKFIIDLFPDV